MTVGEGFLSTHGRNYRDPEVAAVTGLVLNGRDGTTRSTASLKERFGYA